MDEFDETLESIEVLKSSTSLIGLFAVCLVSAFTHYYTENVTNAMGSILLAMCTGFFVLRPTFFSITLIMSSSLLYFLTCFLIILSSFTTFKTLDMKNKASLDLFTIALDLLTAGGIFSITNHIWNAPSHKSNHFTPHWALMDGKDVSGNVWAPFNGIGRPLGSRYV